MIRFTKRAAKRSLIVGAALLAGGLLTFGGASEADAGHRHRCGGGGGWGYGPGYYAGYGGDWGGYGPSHYGYHRGRGAIVTPVYGYNSFYRGGPAFYGGRGVGISIGF
ncbi:hypothetical protein [Botrimarina sp.]|uniref:hypothetical protein n=1 Tax=Botrimarina sp. TaxID=2795802 RepID=UPI0032EF2CE4